MGPPLWRALIAALVPAALLLGFLAAALVLPARADEPITLQLSPALAGLGEALLSALLLLLAWAIRRLTRYLSSRQATRLRRLAEQALDAQLDATLSPPPPPPSRKRGGRGRV
jgi:membrane protein implicated in regulation of membrane protease activity